MLCRRVLEWVTLLQPNLAKQRDIEALEMGPVRQPEQSEVDASNAMTLRWILCALVAITRRVVVIVEQPTSSILTSMPHFLYLADVAGALWSRVQLCPSLIMNTPNKYVYIITRTLL